MSKDYDEKINNFFKHFEIPELQNAHLLQSNKSTSDNMDEVAEKEEIEEELSQAIAMSLEEDDETKYGNDNGNDNDDNDDDDDDSSHWTCPYCTYRNNNTAKVCEMCAVGDIDTTNHQTLFQDDKTVITIDPTKSLNLEMTIYLLFNLLDDKERKECLRVVSKTCNKLCDNITSWEKYGNLNYEKISQKLSKCLFAMNLFENAGFKKQDTVEKGERLIWNMDIENIQSLKKVVDILKLEEAYLKFYAKALLGGTGHDETMKFINQIKQARSGNFVCVCGKCHLKNK